MNTCALRYKKCHTCERDELSGASYVRLSTVNKNIINKHSAK